MRLIPIMFLASLAASPAIAAWEHVDTKKEFKELVVDKKFVAPNKAWFSFLSNGKITGGANGKELTGKWRWRGKFACYDRKLGGEKFPSTCVLIQVDGKKLSTTTEKGKGRTAVYTLSK